MEGETYHLTGFLGLLGLLGWNDASLCHVPGPLHAVSQINPPTKAAAVSSRSLKEMEGQSSM